MPKTSLDDLLELVKVTNTVHHPQGLCILRSTTGFTVHIPSSSGDSANYGYLAASGKTMEDALSNLWTSLIGKLGEQKTRAADDLTKATQLLEQFQ